MSVRYNVVLTDELNKEIDQAAEESQSTKSEIMRKALTLYLAAREADERGLKVGFFEPETKEVKTEVFGL